MYFKQKTKNSINILQLSDLVDVLMCRAHTNPIFNTRMYQIECAGGEVTELTTNVIAESMYTQYDADGNVCLLLESIADYCKDNKAISPTEQQIERIPSSAEG